MRLQQQHTPINVSSPHLWGVDDGRAHHAAVHTAVADGEGAARHVIDADRTVPRLLAQCPQVLLNARETQLQQTQRGPGRVCSQVFGLR